MMSATETIAGLDDLKAKIRTAAERATAKAAQVIVKNTQANAPVRTGALRASIFADPVTNEGESFVTEVGPHIVYGRILDMGGVIRGNPWLAWDSELLGRRFVTKKPVTVPARGYFRTGVEESQDEINDIIAQEIARILAD
jgi:HK97 gp10 family phage protein